VLSSANIIKLFVVHTPLDRGAMRPFIIMQGMQLLTSITLVRVRALVEDALAQLSSITILVLVPTANNYQSL